MMFFPGKPLEPHTDPNATFQISASMISGKHTSYTLQVKGDSLIEDGILDGDYVVIEKAQEVVSGDIIVAIVDDIKLFLYTILPNVLLF